MKIHEYQGKELLRRYDVPVPFGVAAMSLDEARKAVKTVQDKTGSELVLS